METCFAGGRGKPDDPVQAPVIGNGETRQTQHQRPVDELVHGGCAVEE